MALYRFTRAFWTATFFATTSRCALNRSVSLVIWPLSSTSTWMAGGKNSMRAEGSTSTKADCASVSRVSLKWMSA